MIIFLCLVFALGSAIVIAVALAWNRAVDMNLSGTLEADERYRRAEEMEL